jgi:CubicO group peptidase (beta-lactamase class C family)
MTSKDGLGPAIDAWLADYAGDVPGASVLVRQDGQDRVAQACGLADVEGGIAASVRTNYRLASISKQFTAAAVLLLAEQQRLTLDAPVGHWLPGLSPACASITLLDLMTHRSGLADYEDLPWNGSAQWRDADVLEQLAARPTPDFPPGGAYRYSNGGYALLALVVERAADQDFPGFLRQRIFSPLGMQASLARTDEGPAVTDRAYGHSLVEGQWRRTDQGPTTAVLGDGGIYSSVADLALWADAWDDSRLLTADSRRLATTAWTDTDEPGTCYGLGWRISGDCVWHSGESLGFRNVLLRIPSRRLTVVMLSNRDTPEPGPAARAIAQRLVG